MTVLNPHLLSIPEAAKELGLPRGPLLRIARDNGYLIQVGRAQRVRADAAGYFGLTIAELERTYLHHHPRFQEDAADAMDRRK